ncbi:MAG: endonuclease/exonuclease/phosphatase family protein [Acidimicrobiia bacterium]
MSLPSATAGWIPPERVTTRLRVLTWNVWWRFGPWEARQPAILETLRRVDPDVICLQEVWETRDGESQPRSLAEELGYHYVAAAGLGLDVAPESMGNAVLSRWPIAGGKAAALPAPKGLDEMRVILRADIDGPRGPLQVFCTHLNWRLDQSHVRQQQVATACQYIGSTHDRREYPPILCGDMNAEPDSAEMRQLTGLAAVPTEKLVFLDAWRVAGDGGPGWTWSRLNPFAAGYPEPDRRIDYVLAGYPQGEGARGEILSARVEGVAPVDDVQPSDHYAVCAELRY